MFIDLSLVSALNLKVNYIIYSEKQKNIITEFSFKLKEYMVSNAN